MLDKKCKMCLKENMAYHEQGNVDRHLKIGMCLDCGAVVRQQLKPLIQNETWLNLENAVLILDKEQSDTYWDKQEMLKEVINFLRTDETCPNCKEGLLEPTANLDMSDGPTPMKLFRQCKHCDAEPTFFTDDEETIRTVIDFLRSMDNVAAQGLSVVYEARLLGFNVLDHKGELIDVNIIAQLVMENANDRKDAD